MLSKPEKLIYIVDFDGTITIQDTLVSVFNKYCKGDWWSIENRMRRGEISRTEALFREVELMQVCEKDLKEHLENFIDVRGGFSQFLDTVRKNDRKLLILSGGFRKFISIILKKHGHSVDFFGISSNDIRAGADNRWEFVSNPDAMEALCSNCPNCKKAVVEKFKRNGFCTVYIGDGDTDFCASVHADTIFAVSELAEKLKEKKVEFYPFKDFNLSDL